MTPNKEDYLKLIYELGGYHKKISNKAIVSGLDVSPASVSEMVTKMEKDKLVTHTPYQGVQLTNQGMAFASSLIRKHRLWEVFLVEHLHYSWDEVHAEAEILEHSTSDELSNRLEKFLGHPSSCPHGGIIPSPESFIEEPNQISLIEVKIGQAVTIMRVLDETELLEYLASLNIKIGETFTIKEISGYEGPLTLLTSNNEYIYLSQKAAHNIYVKIN